MFSHQYSTEACVESNLKVGSFRNNVAPLQRVAEPRGKAITANTKAVGELEFDGMANTYELLINAVKVNKPKVLTGLNQKVRDVVWGYPVSLIGDNTITGEQAGT